MIKIKHYLVFVVLLFSVSIEAQITPVTHSMDPYNGPWTFNEASHLLRRTLYGPRYSQIADAVNNGMDATVDDLLQVQMWSEPPLVYLPADALVGIGNTWVNSPFPVGNVNGAKSARGRSIRSWIMMNALNNDTTIAAKMDNFWHNHFAVTFPGDPRMSYQYWELLRTHSLGNFKDLVKDITVTPAMLKFLNGNRNHADAPNENYARELLELFSIGRGEDLGNGDFSRYTEQDVVEGAKILTGYKIQGASSTTVSTTSSVFDPSRHDNSVKTLSAYFDSASIAPNGADEYKDHIDVIFSHPDFSDFICEKLYRYFVSSYVTAAVRDSIIPEMAATLTNNNFSIKAVMSQLLKSKHFYDVALRGCLVKSPFDYMYSMFNATNAKLNNPDLVINYSIGFKLFIHIEDLGMPIYPLPSVAGWPAYYLGPAYSRLWIDSESYKQRDDYLHNVVLDNGVSQSGVNFNISPINFINDLPNPSIADSVVEDMAKVLIIDGNLSSTDLQLIKDELLDGGTDADWTALYNNYLMDPTTYQSQVGNKVKAALGVVFSTYIFQTF